MKTTKTIIISVILALMLISTFSLVYAEDLGIEAPKPVERSALAQFFIDLQYRAGFFTVAGRDRECGTQGPRTQNGITCTSDAPTGCWNYAEKVGTNPNGQLVTLTRSYLQGKAGCTQALVNTYTSSYGFVAEFNLPSYDTFYVWNNGYVEVYCCPYAQCTSNANCVAWGEGTTCNPSTGACSGTVPTWTTQTYTCNSQTGNWISNGAVSYGNNRFCSFGSNYKNYVTPNSEASGACYTSPPAGWCVACSPSSSCASNTCIGQTCSDGCGGSIQGTKSCTGCTPSSSCASNTCIGQTCSDGCGGSIAGTKTCTGGGSIEVSNIILPTGGRMISAERTFKATLTNKGSSQDTIYVEAGFYTPTYAIEIAKLYSNSILPIFSVVNPTKNCVETEEFVKTLQVTLEAGETKTITIEQSPLYAYVTLPRGTYTVKDTKLVAFLGAYKSCCQKIAGFEGCAEGTGGYIGSKYDPNFVISESSLPSFTDTQQITCGGISYGTYTPSVLGQDKITITGDYRKCVEYKFYLTNGSIDTEAIQKYKEEVLSGALSKANKLSLTKKEISSSTTIQLLASACKLDSECVKRSNYTVSCNSVGSLREEGTLSENKVTDFFSTGKTLVTNGVIGGSVGGATGLALCALGVFGATAATVGTGGTAVPLLVPAAVSCTSIAGAGALIGAGLSVGGTLLFDSLTEDDELVKALKGGNANEVGICTAEEGAFDLGSFFSKIGKSIKITGNQTWDGIIVIVGGLFLLVFLFSLLGGRK